MIRREIQIYGCNLIIYCTRVIKEITQKGPLGFIIMHHICVRRLFPKGRIECARCCEQRIRFFNNSKIWSLAHVPEWVLYC